MDRVEIQDSGQQADRVLIGMLLQPKDAEVIQEIGRVGRNAKALAQVTLRLGQLMQLHETECDASQYFRIVRIFFQQCATVLEGCRSVALLQQAIGVSQPRG